MRGASFLAQLNTLALYPLSLFYLLLPLTWAMGVFCLLHIFLAGMGMYFLAARWTDSRAGAAVAGVVFAFNGLALNFVMWPSHLATYAWMPWVILLVEQGWTDGGRALFLAALAGGMEVLGGGPEEILFTWLILFGLLVARLINKPRAFVPVARRFLTIGLLTGGLAAAQLLPFGDFVMHSNRDTHFGDSEWSMPAWGWGNFFVPMFETSKWQQIVVQHGQYWTSSYYMGIGAIFLAVMALIRRPLSTRVWMIGAILVGGMVLASGQQWLCISAGQTFVSVFGDVSLPGQICDLTAVGGAVVGRLCDRELREGSNRTGGNLHGGGARSLASSRPCFGWHGIGQWKAHRGQRRLPMGGSARVLWWC